MRPRIAVGWGVFALARDGEGTRLAGAAAHAWVPVQTLSLSVHHTQAVRRNWGCSVLDGARPALPILQRNFVLRQTGGFPGLARSLLSVALPPVAIMRRVPSHAILPVRIATGAPDEPHRHGPPAWLVLEAPPSTTCRAASISRSVRTPCRSPPPERRRPTRTLWLSLDPYMRGRLREQLTYAQPVKLGQVMTGGTVGEVVESAHRTSRPGDVVAAHGLGDICGHAGRAASS